MPPAARTSALAAWVALAACASHTPAEDAGLGDATTGSDAGTECAPFADLDAAEAYRREGYARLYCTYLVECAFASPRWDDVDACLRFEPSVRQIVDNGWDRVEDELRSGARTFDPELAAARLAIDGCAFSRGHAGVSTSNGERFPDPHPPRCGPAEPGARCSRDGDCAEGSFCLRFEDACSVCRPLREPGDPCERAEQCRVATDLGADVSVCAIASPSDEGLCVAATLDGDAAAGAACGLLDDGPPLGRVVGCADGLHCTLGGDGLSGICVDPRGQPCVERADCVWGLECLEGRCSSPPRHSAPVIGEPCQPDGTCDWSLRRRCVDGTCVAAGEAQGQPCDRSSLAFVPWCADGLYCDESADRCVERHPVGESCAAGYECLSNVCDRVIRRCAEAGGDGASCRSGLECASGCCESASGVCRPEPFCAPVCPLDG